MNDPNLFSIQEQIEDTSAKRPHVVILGAGASLQALPDGDKYGKVLPLMNNFVEVLELKNLLEAYGVDFHGKNFEELYSSISSDPAIEELTKILEYGKK